jgi:hypothetical protein
MSIRVQPRDEGEPPRSGSDSGAASIESEMIVCDLQPAADTRPPETVDRRLRNWLLFGNVVAWILVIIVLRWLFF